MATKKYEYDPRLIETVKCPVVEIGASGERAVEVHLLNEANQLLTRPFQISERDILEHNFKFNRPALNTFERQQLRTQLQRVGMYNTATFDEAVRETEARLPCELIRSDNRRLVLTLAHARIIESAFDKIRQQGGLRPTADKPQFKVPEVTIGDGEGDANAPDAVS